MDFVLIGLSYLILSVCMYSSRTSTTDRPQEQTTIFLRLAVLSPYLLLSPPFSVLSSLSYSMVFVTLNNIHFRPLERLLSPPDRGRP